MGSGGVNVSEELRKFAEEFAGNWREFECFAWHDDDIEEPEKWGFLNTSTRDSGIIAQSNEAAIKAEMEPYFESGDAFKGRSRHWACGYVDNIVVRVYDENGEITDAAAKVFELKQRLENYALLDEIDYSNREYEASLEYIEWNGRPRGVEFVDDLPDDWAAQVYSWLFDNGYYFSEEGSGVYLYTRKEDEDEVLAKALLDLGLAEREDDEE